MSTSRTLVFPDHESLTRAAAIYFAEASKEAINDQGCFFVSLCGGQTPELLYETLGSSPYRDYLPWDEIHFFWGDERCVPPEDPDSNFGRAWELWLKHIRIPSKNIHRIHGELTEGQAVAGYQKELIDYSEPGRNWPRFDWVLLGLGSDGHTASLFPGEIPENDANQGVITIRNDKLGRLANRISLTPSVFNDARQVVFLVSGAEKAPILAAIRKGQPDPLRWPALHIQPKEGFLVWMVDEAAAFYSHE